MTKPQEYNEQKVVRHETPYRVDERFPKGSHAGTGVLSAGRVVWTEQDAEAAAEGADVTAFADGIGVVALEATSLRG